MKTVFEEPSFEIIKLNNNDIVCSSYCQGAGNEIMNFDPIVMEEENPTQE